MKQKSALITGITGQDGSYLAEFLLSKDYKVYGFIRRTSTESTERIKHILSKIELIEGDLTDLSSIIRAVEYSKPDEVYNLASMSFVAHSWKSPITTAEITGLGVLNVLEALRISGCKAKFYQASSSELFGKAAETPQSEKTPFYPRSPYGVSKLFGYWTAVNYRESYGMFACNGILFNHESPRRGIEFVTRKITDGVARIKLGLQDELRLGNLDAKRDWGFAGDYVEAMWLMLQKEKPEDYVIGTGETHTVREFVEEAFKAAGIKDYQKYVKVDEKFMRPADVNLLLADTAKAKKELGWKPKMSFSALVKTMVESDIERIKKL
ncbi:MAG: GDP-mannose 4,6-dehydratase [Candidatus Woesearchaeota archaeon]|nr:GDP-mannose 4,6-dehydratase [Candidatus Woesearchaeota archaeon]